MRRIWHPKTTRTRSKDIIEITRCQFTTAAKMKKRARKIRSGWSRRRTKTYRAKKSLIRSGKGI